MLWKEAISDIKGRDLHKLISLFLRRSLTAKAFPLILRKLASDLFIPSACWKKGHVWTNNNYCIVLTLFRTMYQLPISWITLREPAFLWSRGNCSEKRRQVPFAVCIGPGAPARHPPTLEQQLSECGPQTLGDSKDTSSKLLHSHTLLAFILCIGVCTGGAQAMVAGRLAS